MGLLEWLRPGGFDDEPHGMSRRAFFARVVGRGAGGDGDHAAAEESWTFHVGSFPYHDGPVLVPSLQVGERYTLSPDDARPGDPFAVRIERGRDVLGYVPAEWSPQVRRLLQEGADLQCTAASIDPGADLARVLQVRVSRRDGPASPRDPDRHG